MSGDLDPPDHTDRDLAGEYVLGVLDDSDRRAAAARYARDPAFAQAVDAWERRLAPLSSVVEEQPAPASVWTAVESRIGMSGPARAADRERFWERIAFWRWLSGGALGLAAASLAALLVLPRSPVGPTYVAALTAADGTLAFTATLDPQGESVILAPARSFGAPSQVNELWLIPKGSAPLPFAVFARDGIQRVRLHHALTAEVAAAATLAVSLEPEGGSPTGMPTGPVVAQGALRHL